MHNTSALSDHQHEKVARYVKLVAGIELPRHKRKLIETRLSKRLRVTGHKRFADYIKYALAPENKSEAKAMIDSLTTNKTEFFRESVHLERLTNTFNAATVTKYNTSNPLRVWSAACSAGQEPYSIAMALLEVKRLYPEFCFEVFATDINASVLSVAKQAVYEHHHIVSLPEPMRKRYLLKSKQLTNGTPSCYKIAPEVRKAVTFDQVNLHQLEKSNVLNKYDYFDFIFCRNVLIYFSTKDRSSVIKNLSACLSPKGVLVLGLSESLGNQNFNLVNLGSAMHQRQD